MKCRGVYRGVLDRGYVQDEERGGGVGNVDGSLES